MSNLNLTQASRQWASRPDDERFWNLDEMEAALRARRVSSVERDIPMAVLQASVTADGDVALIGPNGHPARMTNWAFAGLCSRIGAPAKYLATLDSARVQDLVDLGLRKAVSEEPDKQATVLLQKVGDSPLVRAITSTRYGRAWDDLLLSGLRRLQDRGWRVPPARPANANGRTRIATQEDVLLSGKLGLSINVGDTIGPAGLYAGDRDSFVFMVNEHAQIDNGTDGGAYRGFFMENSEVGARKFRLTTFLYETVCGNHIVWGASDVKEVEIVHVGEAPDRIHDAIGKAVRGYLESGANEDEARIRRAMQEPLGKDKESVVEKVYARRTPLGKRDLEAAYDIAEENDYNPRSVWGMVQGLTRLSQRHQNADERNAMDRAAGRLVDIKW